MSEKCIALEGKEFIVDLVSRIASTNYGWCLTSMPNEIMLIGTEYIPIDAMRAGGRTVQRFHFGVKSTENTEVKLEFELRFMSNLSKSADKCTVEVEIVPCNSDKFINYSENAEQMEGLNGFVLDDDSTPNGEEPCKVAYGYPGAPFCGGPGVVAYGYPPFDPFCGGPGVVAYGYPRDPFCGGPGIVAYGYPWGIDYGYPCATQNAAPPFVKYGYFCK